MSIKPTKNGIEIEEYLNNVNMDPWFYIYENYVKNDSKEELNQIKQDSSKESS